MAMQQGRAAAAHACGLAFGVVVDQAASIAVYGLPEVADVGATEEQIQADGISYVVDPAIWPAPHAARSPVTVGC